MINVEFILILETEVILITEYITRINLYLNSEFILYIDNLLEPTSFTPINNIVYMIITDII